MKCKPSLQALIIEKTFQMRGGFILAKVWKFIKLTFHHDAKSRKTSKTLSDNLFADQ